MLTCYFIARSGSAVEAMPLSFVRHGTLVAAVRRLEASRPTPERMLEHNAVLVTASQRATVLPLRFGTAFHSEAAVTQLLAARAGELAATLDRLDGKAEMTVRVKLEPDQNAAGCADEIGRVTRPLDSRSEVRTDRFGHSVLELAHLVSRDQVGEYRRLLEEHGLEATGPWPPLHFLPQFLRMPARAERAQRAAAHRAG